MFSTPTWLSQTLVVVWLINTTNWDCPTPAVTPTLVATLLSCHLRCPPPDLDLSPQLIMTELICGQQPPLHTRYLVARTHLSDQVKEYNTLRALEKSIGLCVLKNQLYSWLVVNALFQLFKTTRHLTSKPKRTWNVRTVLPTYNVGMGNAYDNFLWTKIQLIRNQKLFDFWILEVSVYKKWKALEVWNSQNSTWHTQKPILGHKKFENPSNGSKVMTM